MCRLALIVGTDVDVATKAVEAFVRASRCDPYLADLSNTSTKCAAHSDGWGFTLIEVGDRGVKTAAFYKSGKPVYDDSQGLSHLTSLLASVSGGFALLLHSRKASVGSPGGYNAHPFVYEGKGFTYWLAHNGTADEVSLRRVLGISEALDVSDTQLLGRYIYGRLESLDFENVAKAYSEAVKYIKTAMNTVSLAYSSRDVTGIVTSYVVKSYIDDEKRLRYYKLLAISGGSVEVFASSTLGLYLNGIEGEVSELPVNSGVYLKIGASGVLEKKGFSLGF